MRTILSRFPVQVALVALAVYLVTLSLGVTANSMLLTAKVAGWDWQPMVGHPVLWLVTLPLRLFPEAWVAVGLNVLSAICAAATLGLLVRSLELLPWYPWEMLNGWKQHVPAILAAVVCGLEFTFWQEATAATGEMLDILLLAAAGWCALEFGVNRHVGWLYAAALIWGMGMAANWVMILMFPFFIAALIWMRRVRFFQAGFLLRIAGFGLAGFAVYALVPLANGFWPGTLWTPGQAWILSFRETKVSLLNIKAVWSGHRLIAGTAVLFYLLPVMACTVRLRSEDSRNKSGPELLQIWIFRGLRMGLLLMGVWMAFNPLVGLRRILMEQLHWPLPLLSFNYLNGLAVGFLAAHLLLMHRDEDSRRRGIGRQPAQWLEWLATPVIYCLLLLSLLGLILRNTPGILSVNRHPLTQIGDLALKSLPPGGGVVLSDSPDRLLAFQAAQALHTDKSDWLPVDVSALPGPTYRASLDRKRPGLWLVSTNHNDLGPQEMVFLLSKLTQTNRVFYLHPSFGYFFESFFLQPMGAVYELKAYETNSINPPALTADEITATEEFWDESMPEMKSLEHTPGLIPASIASRLDKALRLNEIVLQQDLLLKTWYSLALDAWGVDLQRNGHLPAALRLFTQAINLNTNNWIAKLNSYSNTNLQSGSNMDLSMVGALASRLGSPKNLPLSLRAFGPVDEPSCCYLLGTIYERDALARQALQQFERARVLAPKTLPPQLELATLYTRFQINDQALQNINSIRAVVTNMTANPFLDIQLSMLETAVWLQQTNVSKSHQVLNSLVARHDQDTTVINRVAQAYMTLNDFTNAAMVISNSLALEPDNISTMLLQSSILIKAQRSAEAISVLDRLLTITNSPEAKFNRGLAFQQSSNYPAAKADYSALQELAPNSMVLNFCMGDLAAQQHDTNQAVYYYTLCLSNAPAGSPQWNAAHERLKSLSPDKKP